MLRSRTAGPAVPGLTHRPVTFVAFVCLGVTLAYLLAGTITHVLGLSPWAMVAIADTILLAVGGGVLWRRGGLPAAGIRARSWRQAFTVSAPLFLPAAVTLALALAYGGQWRPASVLGFFVLAALVGLTEEILFRGLVFGALRRTGARGAVAVSAALFGLLHMLNIAAGAGVLATVLQVLYAFALGCAMAAALEVGGRLLPLVAAHASTDLFAYIAGAGVVERAGHEGVTAAITVATILVLGAYTAWLLRRPPAQAAVVTR